MIFKYFSIFLVVISALTNIAYPLDMPPRKTLRIPTQFSVDKGQRPHNGHITKDITLPQLRLEGDPVFQEMREIIERLEGKGIEWERNFADYIDPVDGEGSLEERREQRIKTDPGNLPISEPWFQEYKQILAELGWRVEIFGYQSQFHLELIRFYFGKLRPGEAEVVKVGGVEQLWYRGRPGWHILKVGDADSLTKTIFHGAYDSTSGVGHELVHISQENNSGAAELFNVILDLPALSFGDIRKEHIIDKNDFVGALRQVGDPLKWADIVEKAEQIKFTPIEDLKSSEIQLPKDVIGQLEVTLLKTVNTLRYSSFGGEADHWQIGDFVQHYLKIHGVELKGETGKPIKKGNTMEIPVGEDILVILHPNEEDELEVEILENNESIWKKHFQHLTALWDTKDPTRLNIYNGKKDEIPQYKVKTPVKLWVREKKPGFEISLQDMYQYRLFWFGEKEPSDILSYLVEPPAYCYSDLVTKGLLSGTQAWSLGNSVSKCEAMLDTLKREGFTGTPETEAEDLEILKHYLINEGCKTGTDTRAEIMLRYICHYLRFRPWVFQVLREIVSKDPNFAKKDVLKYTDKEGREVHIDLNIPIPKAESISDFDIKLPRSCL